MRGFTIFEVLTLVGIMAVLAALVIVLMPQPIVHVEIKEVKVSPPAEPPDERSAEDVLREAFERDVVVVPKTRFESHKTQCLSNVRNIVGLLEFGSKYPVQSGPNLILYLVAKGELEGESLLNLLFCPGDENESLEKAGGVDAYKYLDLTIRGEYGHMTSYAGRDQISEESRACKGSPKVQVLICDDSEDHHDGRGFVVGLTGGAAKWRDKVRAWKVPRDTRVEVGEGSVAPELRCLRTR